VAKANGDPYTVFTPFSRAWQALRPPSDADLLPAPPRLKLLAGLASEAVPRGQAPTHFLAGEGHARATLRTFTEGAIFRYGEMRDRLDSDGTSALSPYLRFGMISAREVVVAARRTMGAEMGARRESAEKWLNELIWREFYCAILYHFPEVLQHAFRPELRDVAWANDPDAFAAWREGRTGYPVVDAAMRQLAATGWMPNRARMITASFLVKDLLIDWRWGERWFMQHLIDGDLAANSGGWQWVAGAGADAAPYFRVFNPTLQARKFDPYGDFSRAWVRELRAVPDQYVHEPWTMPAEVQRQARCFIGQDYPAPIIEHAFARQRTLAAFRRPRPAGQASR
jgi:deoxyribodipyrimidine photo-lyase